MLVAEKRSPGCVTVTLGNLFETAEPDEGIVVSVAIHCSGSE